MASPFSHAVAALALGGACHWRRSWRFWFLTAASAALPDADFLGFAVGIPYESVWGHRGFTHSLLFAGLWAAVVVGWEFPQARRWESEWWRLWSFFAVVTTSHGVLDAFTNGGLGVGFFTPFSPTRYFFPWTPIEVSPLSIRAFFTTRGWAVLANELLWIWLPAGALWGGAALLRRAGRRLRAGKGAPASEPPR